MTGVRSRKFSGCDDGGILKRCVGFESALIRLLGFAGKDYVGDVSMPLDGGADAEAAALQQGVP